jgi:hypothetical protein
MFCKKFTYLSRYKRFQSDYKILGVNSAAPELGLKKKYVSVNEPEHFWDDDDTPKLRKSRQKVPFYFND